MGKPQAGPSIYGLMAEFDSAQALVIAARKAYKLGYRQMDGYTPFPVEELSEALGHHHSPLPKIVLAGGITGLVTAYALQYGTAVIAYPLNVGGRPLHSWPSFIPVSFELTVLFAAFAAVFGMLALNGLPTPYHPVFNVPRFALASRDRYFLCIEAADPKFDRKLTEAFLESLSPDHVSEVER